MKKIALIALVVVFFIPITSTAKYTIIAEKKYDGEDSPIIRTELEEIKILNTKSLMKKINELEEQIQGLEERIQTLESILIDSINKFLFEELRNCKDGCIELNSSDVTTPHKYKEKR